MAKDAFDDLFEPDNSDQLTLRDESPKKTSKTVAKSEKSGKNSTKSTSAKNTPKSSAKSHKDAPKKASSRGSKDKKEVGSKKPKKVYRVDFLSIVSDLLFTAAFFVALYFIWMVWWTAVPAYYEQQQKVSQSPWDAPEDPNKPAVPLDYLPCDASGSTNAKYQEIWGDDWKAQYDANWKEPSQEITMIGRSYVPRWGADYSRNIVQGTNKVRVLDRQGYGHYEGTAMPGCVGNFAAAAHRDGYGAPMGDIDKLVQDDALVVRTQHYWYVYDMTSYEIVEPSNGSVIAPVPGQLGVRPSERLLTYTTCHPRWSLDQRYIVHAKLKYWAEVKSGVPQEMLDVGTHISM